MEKTLIGIVTSDKADKTITVSIKYAMQHPVYKKQYTSTRKLLAHDPDNKSRIGDLVSIVESKPISKNKKFELTRILKTAELTEKDKAVLKEETEEETNTDKQTTKADKTEVEE